MAVMLEGNKSETRVKRHMCYGSIVCLPMEGHPSAGYATATAQALPSRSVRLQLANSCHGVARPFGPPGHSGGIIVRCGAGQTVRAPLGHVTPPFRQVLGTSSHS